jgi:hypothetical protein
MSEDKPSGFQSMKCEMDVVRVCEPLPPPPVSGSDCLDIEHMTDDWVDAGQHCGQDVINLRDEVRRLREIVRYARVALECERDSFPTLWKHSSRLKGILRKCQNTEVSHEHK